jgi:hypothetical protein
LASPVEDEPLVHAHRRPVPQAHPRDLEDLRRHRLELLRDPGSKRQLCQHVALGVEAGRDLDQLESLLGEPEDAPLGDVVHRLAASGRQRAVERHLAHLLDDLRGAGLGDVQQSVRHLHRRAGSEGPEEEQGLRVLADVDEATRTRHPATEPADVHVPQLVAANRMTLKPP